jgi:hypothetical protein
MSGALHIPILRHGRPYESLEKEELCSFNGQGLAEVSVANPGLIEWDSGLTQMSAEALRAHSTRDIINMCTQAAKLFVGEDLALDFDGAMQSPDDYLRSVSATTGLPQAFCRTHMQRLHDALLNLEQSLYGLTRGLTPEDLDRGTATIDGFAMRHVHKTNCLAAVLPSNAPGVNALWFPALGLRTPVAIRPGHADPWTPLRLIAALVQAGLPKESFSFYPSGHVGGHALVRSRAAAMVFGGSETVALYGGRASVELHGSGQSKLVFGPDQCGTWDQHMDLIDQSVLYNGGRSCINASTIVVTEGGKELAELLAERWSSIQPGALDDVDAQLAGFVDPDVASDLNDAIDVALKETGARDVSSELRGSDRLVQAHGLSFLLPTVLHCELSYHPLSQVERPFPMVSVVEMPAAQIADWMSYSLSVTVVSEDADLLRALTQSEQVGNLHLGPIPTTHKDWGQPHEGNLFELLMRRSAIAGDA